jgi:hypothetical protein
MAEPKQKKRKAEPEEKKQMPLRGLAAKWLRAESDATVTSVLKMMADVEEYICGDGALGTDVSFDVTETEYENEDFRRCVASWLKHNGVFSCFSTSGQNHWQLNVYRVQPDEGDVEDPEDLQEPKNPITREWLAKKIEAIT